MPPKKSTPKAPAAETAASARPRRAAAAPAVVSAPPPATKKRAAPKKAAEPAPKRAKAAPKAKKTEDAPSKPEPVTGAVEEETKAAPRKRGRPPKGGETTKATVLEEAAEQQLEDELLDTTAAAGAGKEGGKGEQTFTIAASSTTLDIGDGASKGKKKNYWLMKAEQEDRFETAHNGTQINTKFTIDDLRHNTQTSADAKPELWDGVRNHVAANHMRAMRKGDLAFFYASGGKGGRSPGIVGTMEVVSEAEWDVTTEDPGAYGYVEEGKREQRRKWVVVAVVFRSKLDEPVSLKKLQEHKEGKLAGMQLFRQSRLSVAKVDEEEWRFIMDELVGG